MIECLDPNKEFLDQKGKAVKVVANLKSDF
jgi:hypothetical protein